MTEPPDLDELARESRMGGAGREVGRDVPVVDLADFADRRAEISRDLWAAAGEIGFFQLASPCSPRRTATW